MSITRLKNELQKLTKEQLIEQITVLYDTYKPVKEYYENYLNPRDIQEVYENYKVIIVHEFYPETKSWNPKMRFSVTKKAIADFGLLKLPSEMHADLMVTLAENAYRFTFDYGVMTEQFYNNVVKNFERALKYLQKEDFRQRCEESASNMPNLADMAFRMKWMMFLTNIILNRNTFYSNKSLRFMF